MRYRLVLYDTQADDKYESELRYEVLGDRNAIWFLWWNLTQRLKYKHVEVFNLGGTKLQPEKGAQYMYDNGV